MSIHMPPAATAPEAAASICVDKEQLPFIEIRATGDVILDVLFENTSTCNKSFPNDLIRQLRASKSPTQSSRICYRVRLETLKRQSRYFEHLLGPNFAEGAAIAEVYGRIERSGRNPSEIGAVELPRIKIVDEDAATKTLGRELIFRDMLRIIHGADHLTKPINTNYLAILTIMADRYNTLPSVTRYIQKNFANFKYPVLVDRTNEEILRQKILIFFHTEQSMRFAAATKELILRGSSRWTLGEEEDSNPIFDTAWWDLPHGLEAELAHRRACVVRTIASIQNQFLAIFSFKDRQCKLGYDSSSSCDSFQLGEMVKFLAKKGLLSLVPFQAAFPEDMDYEWPDAFMGDIENLIGTLRQCPSYQIDKNHTHCGLRTKILPALDYIKSCIDAGLGIRLIATKPFEPSTIESWVSQDQASSSKRSFWVGNEDVAEGSGKNIFLFKGARAGDRWDADGLSGERAKAKQLFTADNWDWTLEAGGDVIGWTRPTYRAMSSR